MSVSISETLKNKMKNFCLLSSVFCKDGLSQGIVIPFSSGARVVIQQTGPSLYPPEDHEEWGTFGFTLGTAVQDLGNYQVDTWLRWTPTLSPIFTCPANIETHGLDYMSPTIDTCYLRPRNWNVNNYKRYDKWFWTWLGGDVGPYYVGENGTYSLWKVYEMDIVCDYHWPVALGTFTWNYESQQKIVQVYCPIKIEISSVVVVAILLPTGP